MKYLARSILVILSVISGVVGAGDTSSSADAARLGQVPTDEKDWSHTHLFPQPALREQIDRTHAYFAQHLTGINNEISRLKAEGILDRRSATKIRNALDHAAFSIAAVVQDIEANEQIDGWSARMISYELGMAADTLAQQADPIEKVVSAEPNGGNGVPDGFSPEVTQQFNLASKLKETSNLLEETARLIVLNLK